MGQQLNAFATGESGAISIQFKAIGDGVAKRNVLAPGLAVFLATAAIISGILFIFIIRANGGVFGFSLDDAYIDLALGSHILDGHYGLNPNEAASPSSSIIFPFLVAMLLKLGGGQVTVLLVNLLFTTIAIFILVVLIADAGIDLSRISRWRVLVAASALLLGLNLIGVAFTGLEHPIHIADTLACLLGIVRAIRTGRMPWWLPVVLVLNPLIRFEGLSVWAAGIIVLWKQKPAAALLTLAAGLFFVASFSLYLHHLGLPLLPSSVMAKSSVAGSVGIAAAFERALSNLLENLRQYGAVQLLALLALLTTAFVYNRTIRDIALFAALPILAHLVFGAFGWFGRYEIYVLTLGLSAVLVLYTHVVSRWLTAALSVFAAGTLIWFIAQAGYVLTTLLTPRATHEIYLQQFQMHRFATEFWHMPVAVDDLGWVSYGNPNYVLDLWGLGSEAARVARAKAGSGAIWMEQLVQQHHVGLAMIFTSWFPARPADWVELATLTLDDRPVAAGDRTVTFFATNPGARVELENALKRFAPTVPPGATLALNF